eukprot:s141_g33.t1
MMRFLLQRCVGAQTLYLQTLLLLGLHSRSAGSWESHLLDLPKIPMEDELFLRRMIAHVDLREVQQFQKPFPCPVSALFLRSWEASLSQARSTQEGFEKADGATGALVRKYLASADLEEGSEQKPVKVLVKEEKSVIIEAAVADLMQFAEQLIWENPQLQKIMKEMDLKPEDVKVTYSVVATRESQVMVKMLMDATQLEVLMKRPAGEYQPKDTHRSLIEILNQRHHRDICRALDILAFTSAVSTVLSFTVHLGDRHAGNVMLRDNGAYLHIDYGYVLGNQPGTHLCYGANPQVRLDYSEIFTAITEDRMKNVFFEVVKLSYQTLRDHYDEMVAFVADIYRKESRCQASYTLEKVAKVVTNGRMAPEELAHQKAQNFLAPQLLPGLTEVEGARFIEAFILHERDHWQCRMHDSNRAFYSSMPGLTSTTQVVASGTSKVTGAVISMVGQVGQIGARVMNKFSSQQEDPDARDNPQ